MEQLSTLIHSFNMTVNNLETEGIQCIAGALKVNTSLQKIGLSSACLDAKHLVLLNLMVSKCFFSRVHDSIGCRK
jgi:hypothetical protein